jgi:hypothetical protein
MSRIFAGLLFNQQERSKCQSEFEPHSKLVDQYILGIVMVTLRKTVSRPELTESTARTRRCEKTTILYKPKLGEVIATTSTIGKEV